MFNYRVLDGEKILENHTLINVEFSNGIESHIKEYSLTNDTKDFDLETLKITQFIGFCEILNLIYEEFNTIYDKYGEINFGKNKIE